ncbi:MULTISPECIES: diguanylate cyclase [unclassified Anabaena]|uniref:diguanylate cyclase n=1 Tax=unclassified Anabaena TaxID=2619674 RepID=UPI001444E4CC|nr:MULTISPECIES: diguanylate cyclase [unclassified Anabaena]MTJ06187.1 diguanylate cyclase [Anabaena sp. UHCC 0204]MTJ54722.1 diguanylate cyclase [Anabaena sp. UHCC 0253]
MKSSILVFGSNDFLATLPDQILDASIFNIDIIDDLNYVQSHIQITPTDIILVQASLVGSLELCFWLKEQTKLSYIYCILFEDRPELLFQRSQENWEWELLVNAAALEQGADAYIWQIPEDQTTYSLANLAANYQIIIAQFTVGLRKAQKYRDLLDKNALLSAIALADSLTELNNRRALEWDLPKQVKQARTLKDPFSLIILDVDFFKKVNDTHGHLVGDRLLQLLCQRLKNNLRSQDIPFRYGGEEFVILLTNTNIQEALNISSRLNRVVEENSFVINNKLSINITISLGVATLETEDDGNGISLLYRADQCLLEAKATGRNKVVNWDYHHHICHLHTVSS